MQILASKIYIWASNTQILVSKTQILTSKTQILYEQMDKQIAPVPFSATTQLPLSKAQLPLNMYCLLVAITRVFPP